MNRKAIERARADLRRAWQTGDDNLMAAAQLVLLKELRRTGFRGFDLTGRGENRPFRDHYHVSAPRNHVAFQDGDLCQRTGATP